MNKIRTLGLVSYVHIGILLVSLMLFVSVQGLPLLSTLGVEAANFFVAVLGPLIFIAAVLNKRVSVRSFTTLFMREAWWLLLHLAVIVALLFANGLFKKSCSEGSGMLPFFVVAIPPLLLNLSAGVVASLLTRNYWLKFLVILAAFTLYVSAVFFSWWHDPSLRLFTHASVLISSDLLKGDVLSAPVVGFRVATFLLALAVIWFGSNFLFSTTTAMFHRSHPRTSMKVLGFITLVCAFYVVETKSLAALGKSRRELVHDYQLLAEQNGLRIFGHPEKIAKEKASGILTEARYYQALLEERLGGISRQPITIWLHQNDDDKFLYTGARNVHFALPKHREIHIAGTDVPHRVLGHELAHIYVGEHTPSWFGIPSAYFIIPNFAITEGLAVALTAELNVENNLTLIEQAQALYQANVQVNISDLFSINPVHFASAHPWASYLYSGATLVFLLNQIDKKDRPARLRKLIEAGSLGALFENDHDLLVAIGTFMNKLREPIAPRAILWANLHFPKTSILNSDCRESVHQKSWLNTAIINLDAKGIVTLADGKPAPERVTFLKDAGDRLLVAHGYSEALNLYSEALPLTADSGEQAQIKIKMLDALINLGDFDNAAKLLPSINSDLFFDGHQRLLLITAILLQTAKLDGKNLSKACLEFLFANPSDVTLKLAELSLQRGLATRNEILDISLPALFAMYLEARFYRRSGAYALAQQLLNTVLQHQSLLPNAIVRESRITRASALAHLGQRHAALYLFQDLLDSSVSDGERIILQDEIDRLRFLIKG